MFRLNDAVRRHRAQHQPQPELRCVAASVATLSPRARPETTWVVATVAIPRLELAHITLLIKQLREEGGLLQHHGNSLLIRPTHWQQLARLSPHWKALLLFLQTNENGEDDGPGRSA